MAKYAVIDIKGNQYKVKEGDEILVDRLVKEPETRVLLVVDGDKVKIGKPKVRGAKVKTKMLKEKVKGKKLTVLTYKAKSRYRRKVGFRPVFSRLFIDKISP
jgi:large subunit ribosomal protein L21